MANKPREEAMQVVNFRMTAEEIARMDRMADKFGHSRSHYLRNSVLLSLEEDEAFDKVGLIRAAVTVKNIIEWMGYKSKTISENIDNDTPSKA